MKKKMTDPITLEVYEVETANPTYKVICAKALKAGLPPDLLCAIINVESKWKAMSSLGPTIAFNPNVFNAKNLGVMAVNPTYDLSIPDYHERTQIATWKHLYALGVECFNARVSDGLNAIIDSTAFGLGQILGSNYKTAGYGDRIAFYEGMRSPSNQLDALIKHISNSPRLLRAVKLLDYSSLATLYAGSAWKTVYPTWVSDVRASKIKYSAVLVKKGYITPDTRKASEIIQEITDANLEDYKELLIESDFYRISEAFKGVIGWNGLIPYLIQ